MCTIHIKNTYINLYGKLYTNYASIYIYIYIYKLDIKYLSIKYLYLFLLHYIIYVL